MFYHFNTHLQITRLMSDRQVISFVKKRFNITYIYVVVLLTLNRSKKKTEKNI